MFPASIIAPVNIIYFSQNRVFIQIFISLPFQGEIQNLVKPKSRVGGGRKVWGVNKDVTPVFANIPLEITASAMEGKSIISQIFAVFFC